MEKDIVVKKLFTSEQVSKGHPDKICDQISDAILDACLMQDEYSRVACEVFAKNYTIVIGGEITTNATIDVNSIIYKVLRENVGLEYWDKYEIINLLDKQSKDIAQGVDGGGAGDQGMMFGFATNETKEFMPLAYSIATRALIKLNDIKDNRIEKDAKAQVTIDYTNKEKPTIDTFLISTQHKEEISLEELKQIVYKLMEDTAKEFDMNLDFERLVNPTGRFVIGGTIGDAGLTGRKIIADTYGGYAKHGGGAFSGKDPTKVDRSAVYMARYLAKNIVASGLMDKCEIQISYAIGVAEPVSLDIESFGTEKIDKNIITKYILENIDLTPKGIIERLKLRQMKYIDTSTYGHFGDSSKNLSYEQLDLVCEFKSLIK